MQTIKKGSRGQQVGRWQTFLAAQGFPIAADGRFGNKTHQATVTFQQQQNLEADGIVGNNTYLKAFRLGYVGEEAVLFPDRPNFNALNSIADKEAVFGRFDFVPKPTPGNVEGIEILGDWVEKNIVTVYLPQLVGVKHALPDGKVRFHKKAVEQLQSLFADWEAEGLLHLIKTWEGAFYPRFIRGRQRNRRNLSNHSFGTAFDINYEWNQLGQVPAPAGQKGSVRELVKLAHKNGFYWGGHFSRKDGMHFEVAVPKG